MALHQNYKLLQEEVVCSGPSYHLWYLTPNFGAKPPEVQVIERVAEHYDTQETEFGRIYRWCPECVVVECNCGKRKTLTRSELIKAKPACECGKDNTASVREQVILELVDEDYEGHHHPWRYWHPAKDSGIPF